jgi:hypothetical protein
MWPKGDPYGDQLEQLIDQWSRQLASAAWNALESPDPRDPDDHSSAIWTDLRPSEAVILRDAVRDAVRRAHERCLIVTVEELTAAGVEFATQFPDAPRAIGEGSRRDHSDG